VIDDGGSDVVVTIEGEMDSDDDKPGNKEGSSESILDSTRFLPQILRKRVALSSGLHKDKVIKFIVSDGNNWIFGLIDCTRERGEWVCHHTIVSVDHEDPAGGRVRLRECILTILRFLAFWTIVPGLQLKRLFQNTREDM